MDFTDIFNIKDALDIGQPDQGFDVSRFRAQALSRAGVAPQNLFLVNIMAPRKVFGAKDARMLSLFCSSSFLPGINIASMDNIRRQGVGVAPRMPYGVFFGDVQTDFMVDGDGQILDVFHRWANFIVNFDDSHGMESENGNGAAPFEVAYKDDYATRIEIIAYNQAANEFIKYTLEEAYPINVGDVQMGWADTDSIARLPVTFNYRTWKSSAIDASSGSSEFFDVFKNLVSKSGKSNYNELVRDTLNLVKNQFNL